MIIVIPAYEPTGRLLQLIDDIQRNNLFHIVLINDGSSQSCKAVFENAQQKGCIVLNHEENLGKGAALKTAFTYILNHFPSEDGVVCADCDGQHHWLDIKAVAEEIQSHPNSIVLGSREFIGTIPFKSFIGNMLTKSIFSIVSGHQIADTQTGLRGFSLTMLPWLISVPGTRYEYEMNQLLEVKSTDFTIHSIPIQTIYENNNKGSHFRPIVDSIRIYKPLVKFGLSSLTCGILDFILFFLVNWLTNNLLLSVISARILSSLCNYFINRYAVFKAKPTSKKSIIKYYCLALFILTANYLLLEGFTTLLPLFLSKILTEILLFCVSYYVQRKFIFS